MPRSKRSEVRPLAYWWSPPERVSGIEDRAGKPVACLASTYTFHAAFFERELLPRFLGLKFDDTENDRPLIIEREEALGPVRAAVLVDADHIDPAQSTLRWDQLSVRITGGVQHAKVTLLVWERLVRVLVASANLTHMGYRRNREIVGVLDFFDAETSVPLEILSDVVDFLEAALHWVRASEGAYERVRETLADMRKRLLSLSRAPHDFSPREWPRVSFVSGMPRREQAGEQSPLKQVVKIWGNRRASKIIIMTPFVGETQDPVDQVVEKLREIPRTRDAVGSLILPGHCSEEREGKMVAHLPRRFLHAWALAWRIMPSAVPTYIVPRCRKQGGEKVNRELHAKAILIADSERTLLLCGSSNFSRHGMGVGVANLEANLCYVDQSDEKRDGLSLFDRLPVDWDADYAPDSIWPDAVEPPEEDMIVVSPRLPSGFLWATYNQRSAQLTIALDPTGNLPPAWLVRLPGDPAQDSPSLFAHQYDSLIPEDGRLSVQLPDVLRSVHISSLAVHWEDAQLGAVSALLLVQIENNAALLPPKEFHALSADQIITCLISGREVAELSEIQETENSRRSQQTSKQLDSLRAVETSGYLLYRARQFGRGLAALTQRLLGTVRTSHAWSYRLMHDPFGPCQLAEALARVWKENLGSNSDEAPDPTPTLFALGELALAVAHAGVRAHAARQGDEVDLRPLCREVIVRLARQWAEIQSADIQGAENLHMYLTKIKDECEHLLGGVDDGGVYAG